MLKNTTVCLPLSWLWSRQVVQKCYRFDCVDLTTSGLHLILIISLGISDVQIFFVTKLAAILPISSQLFAPDPFPPVAKNIPG